MLPRAAIRPRKRNAPRPTGKSARGFLQWLRGRSCACQGNNPDCEGKIEAAHVDYAAKGTSEAKGTRTKVADKWAIPLSSNCHRLQTNKGWRWFEPRFLGKVGAGAEMAADYWRLWPGRPKWEARHG